VYEIRLTHTKTRKQGLISNVCIPLPPYHSTRNTTHSSLRLPILVRKRIMNENPTHLMFWTYSVFQIIWTPNDNQLPLNTCKKLKNERTIYVCCTVKLGCTEIKFTISEIIPLMLKKKVHFTCTFMQMYIQTELIRSYKWTETLQPCTFGVRLRLEINAHHTKYYPSLVVNTTT
jgi:hypothetical protein